MNLDMLTGHLRSHVFHDDQWPADSSTVTCDIDRFVMVVYINTDKLVDLAGTPQLAELSNKPGGEPSNTNDETVDVDYEGGRSVYFRARGHHNVWESSVSHWAVFQQLTEHCSHLQHLVE